MALYCTLAQEPDWLNTVSTAPEGAVLTTRALMLPSSRRLTKSDAVTVAKPMMEVAVSSVPVGVPEMDSALLGTYPLRLPKRMKHQVPSLDSTSTMAPLPAVPMSGAVVDLALRMANAEPALTSFTVPRQALESSSSSSAGGSTVTCSCVESALKMVLVKLCCTRLQPS